MLKSFLLLCLFIVGIGLVHCWPNENRTITENRIDRYCEVGKCNRYEYTWGPTFEKKIDLEILASNVRSNDYIVRLSLFVKASTTARIRLGGNDNTDQNEEYYEIVLGAENNTKSWLKVSGQTEPLQAFQTPNIVTDNAPHKILIEISEGGLIKVFTEHYTAPLFEAPYINPFRVTYISFAADDNSSAEYFFDCDDALETVTAALADLESIH